MSPIPCCPGCRPAQTRLRALSRLRQRLRLLPVIAVALGLCTPHVLPAQQFTFRQYGRQDGLSNLNVSALLQDREGYLWVGTANGLFRYDSTNVQRFDDTSGLADTAGAAWSEATTPVSAHRAPPASRCRDGGSKSG